MFALHLLLNIIASIIMRIVKMIIIIVVAMIIMILIMKIVMIVWYIQKVHRHVTCLKTKVLQYT